MNHSADFPWSWLLWLWLLSPFHPLGLFLYWFLFGKWQEYMDTHDPKRIARIAAESAARLAQDEKHFQEQRVAQAKRECPEQAEKSRNGGNGQGPIAFQALYLGLGCTRDPDGRTPLLTVDLQDNRKI
jgi:hypothetical protein